ncbi:hypothetical protein PAPYR_3634 [Paratrimastix pyriformis]|uniref:DUF2721 domain-containing protein n=1 Tax=Paratrimastix pyriformis TaxID=342808 RepID=A0ABQ8UM45_9EUKA|nr:hypothetical protein PAPYR_3634 [Paratrimastix pyriformis]
MSLGARGLTLITNAVTMIPNTLLSLGYFHRFSHLTDLYRKYGGEYQRNPSAGVFEATKRAANRLNLARAVIAMTFSSLLLQLLTYILLVSGAIIASEVIFGIALGLFLLGLVLSIAELGMQQRTEKEQLDSMRMGTGMQQQHPTMVGGQPFKEAPSTQAGAGIDRPSTTTYSR